MNPRKLLVNEANPMNMEVVRLLINEEMHELSQDDKNIMSDSIYYLMDDVEINSIWMDRINELDITLERYVFNGVVRFMKERDYTPVDLWRHEDDCEIFDCIHRF